MNKLLFGIGILLTISGTVWISFVFSDGNKVFEELFLEKSNSADIKLDFVGNDIGYYKIFISNFEKNVIFLQVLDTNSNIISEQSIQTKLSVGYFDFQQDGKYSIKITNISEKPIELHVEFGNTNSTKMIPAGIIGFIGIIMIIVASFIQLKNYKIAQPDENIS